MNLNYREYDEMDNVFGDANTVCGEVTEYSDSTYLCDAITEVADSNVPSYNDELFSHCAELNEYVEEAISQGLAEGCRDLVGLLNAGAYEFYSQLLNENLATIIYNIAIEFINNEYDSELIERVCEYDLESELSQVDNNDTIDRVKDVARSYMEDLESEMQEEEEEEEEEE